MKHVKGILIHSILILICIFCMLPFLWLVSTALKGGGENIFQYPPVLIPKFPTMENFTKVLKLVPIIKYALNSFIVAFFTVVLNLIFSCLAAYPLARMNFRGKNAAFFLILVTLTVPFQAIMLPVYIIILKMNLVDTVSDFGGYLGMILPFCTNAFGIFLMRQAFLTIPKEIEESAFLDGCNSFQVFYKILIPLVMPSVSVLAIFTFVGSWGEFLWPSIILTKQSLFTLPVGINELQGAFSADYRLVAAGAVVSIIPIILFFLALQKYFIKGGAEGAVKG